MTETDEMTPATSEESIAVPEPSGRRRSGRHASYNVLVKRAVVGLKAKSGSSRKAIIRYICVHETVKKSHCIRAAGRALKRMTASGHLYRNKNGRYKLTGKGRGISRKKRRRRGKKGRKGRRSRRRKGKKSKKGKKKKGKKSKKGKKKKARKGRKSRKSRRSRRRKAPKRAHRRRKAPRRKGKGKKRSAKRRRR